MDGRDKGDVLMNENLEAEKMGEAISAPSSADAILAHPDAGDAFVKSGIFGKTDKNCEQSLNVIKRFMGE